MLFVSKFVAAKNPVRPRKNTAEGGGGGGSSAVFLQKREASPAALLVQSRTPKKSFVFLLEEKIRRAQIRKCEQNFSLVWRALASGGGAVQSFRSKWVRAKFRIEQYIYFFIFSNSESRAL